MSSSSMGRCNCRSALADFLGGEQLAIEVKLPSVGDHERDASRVASDLFMGFMSRLRWLPSRLNRSRATFRFARSIVELDDRHGVPPDLVDAWVREAAGWIERQLRDLLGPQTIDLGRIGSLITVREECLDHFVVMGERHLRHLLREFVLHYHGERYHQGLDCRIIRPMVGAVNDNGASKIVRRARLGGLLKTIISGRRDRWVSGHYGEPTSFLIVVEPATRPLEDHPSNGRKASWQ